MPYQLKNPAIVTEVMRAMKLPPTQGPMSAHQYLTMVLKDGGTLQTDAVLEKAVDELITADPHYGSVDADFQTEIYEVLVKHLAASGHIDADDVADVSHGMARPATRFRFRSNKSEPQR